jgi:hypothetical protein
MQLQREYTELLERLECQAAEDKRIAEALRREHFNKLRARYLQSSKRPTTLLDRFVRKRSRAPLVHVDSGSEVSSGSCPESPDEAQDVTVIEASSPPKRVVPAMFTMGGASRASDSPVVRSSDHPGTSLKKRPVKRKAAAPEPKLQKVDPTASSLYAWFRHGGEASRKADVSGNNG